MEGGWFESDEDFYSSDSDSDNSTYEETKSSDSGDEQYEGGRKPATNIKDMTASRGISVFDDEFLL